MREHSLAGGTSVRVGERPDGAFAVSHRQPDGETVWVLVEPLFGGNSLEPVAGMEVSRADVFRLVQDERLDLPPHEAGTSPAVRLISTYVSGAGVT